MKMLIVFLPVRILQSTFRADEQSFSDLEKESIAWRCDIILEVI